MNIELVQNCVAEWDRTGKLKVLLKDLADLQIYIILSKPFQMSPSDWVSLLDTMIDRGTPPYYRSL